MSTDDGLDRWIDGLRDRLARGALATLPPIDLGDGTGMLLAERTIRIMLADLADLADPGGSWGGDTRWRAERRYSLLGDFRMLRAMIG